MAAQPHSGASGEPPRRQNDLPPEILDLIWPALQLGGICGISGVTIGAFAGVVRSSTPSLFALASGIQWFTLGTTFGASRGFVLQAWGEEKTAPKEKVLASAIAGCIGGSFGGFLRGRKNVIPGAIMFAVFGATGQAMYNMADARNLESSGNARKKSLQNSWLNSKWSPMKALSDKEYEKMLQEKLLKVNVEIALVNENIEALRAQEKEMAGARLADNSK